MYYNEYIHNHTIMYGDMLSFSDICIFCICVASSQNSPLVGRNESGIIHDLSKNNFLNLNFKLFCLIISILINIVF